MDCDTLIDMTILIDEISKGASGERATVLLDF